MVEKERGARRADFRGTRLASEKAARVADMATRVEGCGRRCGGELETLEGEEIVAVQILRMKFKCNLIGVTSFRSSRGLAKDGWYSA